MSEIPNLDKICAEIGFYTCDIYNGLCAVLEEEIKKFKNYSEFESNKENIIEKIKEKVNIEDENKELVEIIFNEIVGVKNEESFKNFYKNLPKFDAKEMERIITKALGILTEDGLFAYVIWLKSEDENPHRVIAVSSLKLLEHDKLNLTGKDDLLIAILENISTNLQKTILAKQILERMLIYAKYRAKALQSD